jgi:hypothetical protein
VLTELPPDRRCGRSSPRDIEKTGVFPLEKLETASFRNTAKGPRKNDIEKAKESNMKTRWKIFY